MQLFSLAFNWLFIFCIGSDYLYFLIKYLLILCYFFSLYCSYTDSCMAYLYFFLLSLQTVFFEALCYLFLVL